MFYLNATRFADIQNSISVILNKRAYSSRVLGRRQKYMHANVYRTHKAGIWSDDLMVLWALYIVFKLLVSNRHIGFDAKTRMWLSITNTHSDPKHFVFYFYLHGVADWMAAHICRSWIKCTHMINHVWRNESGFVSKIYDTVDVCDYSINATYIRYAIWKILTGFILRLYYKNTFLNDQHSDQ